MVYPSEMRVLSALNGQLSTGRSLKKNNNNNDNDVRILIRTFYTRNSIHAINNFLRESTGIYERSTWFIVWTITVIGLLYVSMILSQRYREGTFQTVVASTTYPVYQISFPTIIICNTNRLNWKRLEAAQERFLPGETDKQKLDLFARFAAIFNEMAFGKFEMIGNVSDQPLQILDGINFTKVVTFMTWTCEEFLANCQWRYDNFECCDEFELQKSEIGLCFAFNGLHSERSKKRQKADKFYPYHNSNYGPKSGLQVRLMIRPEDHVPDERNSEDFKSLPGHVYMYENCLSQCRAEYLMRYCNCTLDLLFPQGKYPVCQASDFLCIYKHKDFFRYTKRKGEDEYVFNRHPGMTCKCFRNCISLNYINEVRPTYLPANTLNSSSYVDLDVYYRFDSIVLYRTSLVFSWLDLVVSFGGIAGLFLGCSLISAVEILYFLCVDIPKFFYRRLKRPRITPRNTPLIMVNQHHHHHQQQLQQQQSFQQQQIKRWADGYHHLPKVPRQYNRQIFHVNEENYQK
ncbi:pickpocket protein 19-like isoform X3 [Episyrphus balteatus]|uniref:pickpocket protein 19-like isoform X3 n=1 Tax=Episyrphus balteatus TaxID=286459 RepID=UPI002486AA68|nr:pickpocket protein 19-like isoform X3 [Episyrphus balteatus]